MCACVSLGGWKGEGLWAVRAAQLWRGVMVQGVQAGAAMDQGWTERGSRRSASAAQVDDSWGREKKLRECKLKEPE